MRGIYNRYSRLDFGNYKNYDLGTVYIFDPDYISWCINNIEKFYVSDLKELKEYGVVNVRLPWEYKMIGGPEIIEGMEIYSSFKEYENNLGLEKRKKYFFNESTLKKNNLKANLYLFEMSNQGENSNDHKDSSLEIKYKEEIENDENDRYDYHQKILIWIKNYYEKISAKKLHKNKRNFDELVKFITEKSEEYDTEKDLRTEMEDGNSDIPNDDTSSDYDISNSDLEDGSCPACGGDGIMCCNYSIENFT